MHNFHIDVCQNPELRKHLTALTQAAQAVLVSLHQYCEGWKRHQSLWKSDKAAALDKFQVLPFASDVCVRYYWDKSKPSREKLIDRDESCCHHSHKLLPKFARHALKSQCSDESLLPMLRQSCQGARCGNSAWRTMPGLPRNWASCSPVWIWDLCISTWAPLQLQSGKRLWRGSEYFVSACAPKTCLPWR